MNARFPTTGAGPYAGRRKKALAKAAGQAKVDALLITREEDVGYLSGFTGDDSFLLVGRSWACLLTDGRYDEQAHAECGGIDIHVRTGSMAEAVAAVLKRHTVRNLGVQAEYLTLRWREALEKVLRGKKIVPLMDVVAGLRIVKDEGEVAAIRKSIRIAERAFRALVGQGAKAFVGRTEREVAAELDYRMRLAGADKPAFDSIVAAGAHSSLPHYRPGTSRIRRNDIVLMDWGALCGGYVSDLTRVVFIGRIPPKLVAIHQVVAAAQAAGIAAVRGGTAAKAADDAARSVIEAAGYGKQFIHGLGHGIGRQVHEGPAVGRGSLARLAAGMVVTVEPGIYVPGLGGIRIEDDVLVTRDGRQRLSSLPRSWQVGER